MNKDPGFSLFTRFLGLRTCLRLHRWLAPIRGLVPKPGSHPPLSLLFPLLALTTAAADPRPNFVLILADDISHDDIGPYGNRWIHTPHLDRIAQEALVFDRFYLTASSCSVSRNSIITGRYPHNTGAPELHMPLPASQVTFVQQLRDAGYHTILSGKNHMGDPSQLGFVQITGGRGPSGSEDWIELLKKRPPHLPFFAWFASHDAHHGWDQDPTLPTYDPDDAQIPPFMADGPETRRDFAAFAREVSRSDHFAGKLVAELERQGIADHTYLIYTSDNGRPFPRCKTRLYDSGIQAPLLIRKPGTIRPARTRSLASAIDLAPTFLDLAGVKHSPTIQGVSLAPMLDNPRANVRDFAFSERNWHVFAAHERAVRHGDWLYIRNAFPDRRALSSESLPPYPAGKEYWQSFGSGTLQPWQLDLATSPRAKTELYHTRADPHQIMNLSGQTHCSAIESKLSAILGQWTQETGDSIPAHPTPDRRKGDPQSAVRGEVPGASTQATTVRHPGPIRDPAR